VSLSKFSGFGRKLVAGRYKVLAEVGSGGMGVVYRARDQKTGRDVALKVLHSHLRRDPAYVERFKREALIARALDSRHVVRLLDATEEDGFPLIVMEYVEGITLADRLQRGPLREAEALDIAIQIARALEEAHDKNVLHRDVKPQNVIIDEAGDAKVADFGIARIEEQSGETMTADVLGAIHYMAPERFNQEADDRSDIYSLGVVLYEMLSGRQPFRGAVSFATVRQILDEDPQHLLALLPHLDASLAGLVHACLAKDPAKRPQSALELRRGLEALREGQSGAASQARGRPRTPLARTEHRYLGLRLGLAVLVLAPVLGLVAAFALFTGGRPLSPADATASRDAVLREGPGLDYAELHSVVEGSRLALLSRTADAGWVRVRLDDGREGWLPASAIEGPRDVNSLIIVTSTVPPPEKPPGLACQIEGSEAIAAVMERCAGSRIEFSADCLRGHVCGVRTENGTTVLMANDQTVAYIDSTGNLVVDRAALTHGVRLTGHGLARQPAWSPDGRYLAYVLTEPLFPGASLADQRYAFQLRIIEVDRPANEGVLLASTEWPDVAPWQHRRIQSPQWSPDGAYVYFAWPGADYRAASIFAVEVPRRSGAVDVRALRIDAPRDQSYIPSGLRSLSVAPSNFGAEWSYFGGFTVLGDGTLVLQVCADTPAPRCALGRWDTAQAATLATPAEGESFALAGAGPDGLSALGYVFGPAGDWLIRVDVAGERHDLVRFDATRAGGALFPRAYAVSPDGLRLLVETTAEPRGLSLVGLSNDQDEPWQDGHSPAWFAIAPASARPLGIAFLPGTRFAIPVPTPTPEPTQPIVFFDLEAGIAPGSCARNQELVVRVRNVGDGELVSGLVLVQVSNFAGFVRSSSDLVEVSLRPGESVDIRTGYIVTENVTARVDPYQVLREVNLTNNAVDCLP
jgi:tRNA A-37 threonylcarbamoyl transferase component Bud32